MKISIKQVTFLSVLIGLEIFSPTKSWSSSQSFDFSKYVPNATLVKEKKDEVKVKTSTGTFVKVAFAGDGSFEEASGNTATSGDILLPGMGLLSLKEITDALAKMGKSSSGEWKLEKEFLSGWVYEIDGTEKGQKMEYKVDAKTGQLLKEEKED